MGLGGLCVWCIWAFLGADEHRNKGWSVETRSGDRRSCKSLQDLLTITEKTEAGMQRAHTKC